MRIERTVDARFLVLALMVGGCGPAATPDFVTRLSVEFHLNGATFITQAEAEEIEARFLPRLDAYAGFPEGGVLDCVGVTRVRIVPSGNFACASDPGRTCAGEQYAADLKVAASKCAYDSAYVHELLHWLQECLRDTVDYDHRAAEWRAVDEELAEANDRCAPVKVSKPPDRPRQDG